MKQTSVSFGSVIQQHALKLTLTAIITAVVIFFAIAIGEWKPTSPLASIIAGLPMGIITVILLNGDAIHTYARGYVYTCIVLTAAATLLYFAVATVSYAQGSDSIKRLAAVGAVILWAAINYWRTTPGVQESIQGE